MSAFNQQSKPDPKSEAITSLILGIIIVLLDLRMVIHYLLKDSVGYLIGELWFLWSWLIPILGLVLGIMGLIPKRNKVAKLALSGTILSFVGLVTYIYAVYLFNLMRQVVIPPFTSF